MNLWKTELLYLLRSWRGWTIMAAFVLASSLSIIVGILIDRSHDFPYDQAIDFYVMFNFPVWLLIIGIIVSSLSFDANRNISIFLRSRFSIQQILANKILVYLVISECLFILGFAIIFVIASILFESSDQISFGWMMWGFFFHVVGSVFWVALILFTSAVFKGAVASVLLTLGMIIGVPLIAGILVVIEMLVRGVEMTQGVENVSYVEKVMLWWPAATGDTAAFLSVTQSEIASDKISGTFGQNFELDPYFRLKPLITSLVVSPLLVVYAWHKYSRREI